MPELFLIPSPLPAGVKRIQNAVAGTNYRPDADGNFFVAVSDRDTAVALTAAAAATAAQRVGASGSGAWIEGPTLPSNTGRIVVEADWAWTVNDGANLGSVISVGTVDFRARVDVRSSKRQYESSGRTSGGTTLPNAYTSEGVFAGAERHLYKGVLRTVKGGGAAGGGTDGFLRQFKNGVQIGNTPLTTGEATITNTTTIRFLTSDYITVTFWSFKLWADDLQGDATPTGAPHFQLVGDPAALNAHPGKRGTALFTAPPG